MRVFELARELNISNQEVIAQLRELGVDVTNHMSSVDEGQARKVRMAVQPEEAAENKDVQDKRIKQTVIRRRVVKRKAKDKPAAKAEEPEETAAAKEGEGADEQEAKPAAAPETTEEGRPMTPAEEAVAQAKAEEAAEEAEAAGEAEAEPAGEAEAEPAQGDAKKKGSARIVDRIEPPPAPEAPGRAKEEPGGKRPKRRIVAKRMYRPSKAEEKKLQKIRQARQKKKGGSPTETQPLKAEKRKIKVQETITVGDLAKNMGVKTGEVIKKFIEMGMMVTINQAVDPETAGVIASEYGYEIEQVGFQEQDYLPDTGKDAPEDMEGRPPVVTVMGHVDHGKTSILDAIRKARVAAGEAGGITQHIGAYQVETAKGPVTFLDTPGHEAFTAMRARGAEVTDIVILVVAADDGVMPQTKEAIEHAKAAGVPLVVAINKCDLPDAQPERIRQQLTEYELVPEEWGGENQMLNVSAHTQEGLEELLEAVALQAEIMELKANPNKQASGIVVEGLVEKGRGPVATVIVQDGTLKRGDIVVSGVTSGRVRALIGDTGEQLKEAGPSTPVEILGLNDVPSAGEPFAAVADEKIARQIAENRERKERERELHAQSAVSLENIFDKMQEGEVQELQVVLKADVQGSLEAVKDSLEKLSQQDEQVRIKIVSTGVGAITENDVNLAAASGAVVIGFNTRPDSKASKSAQEFGVDIEVYQIIYKLLEDVTASLEGMLAPEQKEESLGWAKVLQTFPIRGIGTVAGSTVEHGQMVRGEGLRLVRDGQVLYDGTLANLRRFETDVDEVPSGQECGILLENFNKVKEGDELECYRTVEVERTLGETA